MMRIICLLYAITTLASCAVSNSYQPGKKFPKSILIKEVNLLRETLEANHPSLYWYSSKDSIDAAFKYYTSRIEDSMTEHRYAWQILTPIIASIRCGHTSLSYSKGYGNWAKGKVFSSFPLNIAAWGDTAVVRNNLIKKDSIFRKGTTLTSINNVSMSTIRTKIFEHLPIDGYSETINYLRFSSNFPRYHNNEYGLSKVYRVGYLDSASGRERFANIPVFEIKKDSASGKDSSKTKKAVAAKRPSKQQRLQRYRKLTIDSTGTYALMDLNGFTKGGLRKFFRRSFKTLKQQNIRHLAIDLRSNGGGRVDLSTLLTKYVSRAPFRVADSAYMKTKFITKNKRLIGKSFFINLGLAIATTKKADGNFHAGRIERKIYQPKKRLHFDGKLYVLTGGGSFSASTVFCNAVKGQKDVLLIGEETGGGWYGNNGLFIPSITLPHTKLRVRLPLYRIVQFNHISTKGTGVMPDVHVPVTYENFIKNIDGKLQTLKDLIFAGKPIR